MTTHNATGAPQILRRLEGQDEEEFMVVQRIGCPHCSRKFSPEAHKRHIVVCANNKNKPKAPPKASECYTDRFGIRRGGRGSLATSARVSGDKPLENVHRRPSSHQQSTRRRHNSMDESTTSNEPHNTNNTHNTHNTNNMENNPLGRARTRPSSSSVGSTSGQLHTFQNSHGNTAATTKKTQRRRRGGGGGTNGGTNKRRDAKQVAVADEKGNGTVPTTTPEDVVKDVNAERFTRLSHKWGELMFLLRRPIQNAEDMKTTWQNAMKGVAFLQELNETAAELGVQPGTLSRWLLPYDNQTSLADQAATAPPLGSSDLDGLMSHPQRRRLVSEAVGLRSLIRVKIADNADLEQALASVQAIDKFMYRVKQTATETNVSAYDLFQQL